MDTYDPSTFQPDIRRPCIEGVQEKCLALFKHGGSMFSQNNKDNFEDSVSSYGKKSYLRTLQLIKEKSSSTTPSHGNIDFDTEHTTILQYLKSQGFNAGRMPPNPVVTDDMIMGN
ncbi:Protein CBG13814 [Caenorhabditis briggsae]|uniref:Protein CBG13814 n=1 Tax=Caenorhabditis briggsae TaxID=6238 RepID=A8XIR7_CAEBR|nr:Protein CBG13814 [Caenorhabditis briggsae]CAP32542.2 Protein CBG13814 [Caenorhabditis briggsae]